MHSKPQTEQDRSGMSEVAFDAFARALEKNSGIVLEKRKQYLIASRLSRLLARYEVSDFDQLASLFIANPKSALGQAVLDAMTTNETFWFRDSVPFSMLRQIILERLSESSGQAIRVWSAACSTGQEPLSMAMLVDELERSNPYAMRAGVQILATDISRNAIEHCVRAEYDKLSVVRGLSEERLARYFDTGSEGIWRVSPRLRSRVEYRVFNLLDSYALLGRFDVIFCRNVLIYFSAEMKVEVLKRLHGCLRTGGYLILGASETLNDLPTMYQMRSFQPGIAYQAR